MRHQRRIESLWLLGVSGLTAPLMLAHCTHGSASATNIDGGAGTSDAATRQSSDAGPSEVDASAESGWIDLPDAAAGADADAAPEATPVRLLFGGEGAYPRVLRAKDGSVVVSLVAVQASGRKGATILRSADDGATFSVVGHVDDPSFANGLCCATLYELPGALGPYPAGTLLWAGAVGADQDASPMSITVWASTNEGASWSMLPSAFVAGVPRYSGKVSTGVWEPEFSLLPDGTLYCHFSDETAPGHSQRLAAVSTGDLKTWTSPTATVALSDPAGRPGMANVRRGPDGTYFMSYELCGTDACAVHMRTSPDGANWGDPTDAGFVPETVDGKELRHTPTLAWTSGPGADGRFYLLGQMVYDSAGQIAPENGSVVFVNTEGAGGAWHEIPAPVPVPSANAQPFCVNYSSSLMPLDESVGIEVAAHFDDAGVCHAYFANGGL